MKNTQLAFLSEIDEMQSALTLLSEPRLLDQFQDDFYTPFANPALTAFIESHSKNSLSYVTNPMPEELAAGKNTYTYDAHTYHTKVPPEAIMRLIEYYTEPEDLILDPFCGSGMTGVAAMRTGRKVILSDLSPAATFVTRNFVTPIDAHQYFDSIEKILATAYDEEMKLYGTHCRDCGKLVPMEYMVWSYGLICEYCQNEFVLWNVARDEHKNVRESKIKSDFDCPHCGKHLFKRTLKRTQLYPVQVGYRCCTSKLQESKALPDEYDLNLIRHIDNTGIPRDLWYPTAKFPIGINTRQAIAHNLASVNALYTTRNLWAIARLWDIARRWRDDQIALKLMFTVTSLYQRVTKLSEFRFWGGSGNIANYNVPMIFNEQNVFKVFRRKAKTIRDYLQTWGEKPTTPFCVSTQSATNLHAIPENSIDYVFTDPPFGSNINYSEMNFLWEAWLDVFTNIENEAIINRVQHKTLDKYRELMTQALSEIYRVLKPGRWLSLEFHNSSSEVWAAIQAALLASSFEIKQTQTLDKQHGTFNQFVSENAVGYDLILHCQKQTHTTPIAPISTISTTQTQLLDFLNRTLKQTPEDFVVHYLHVNRENELDSRKLYSLWLGEQMESGNTIDLNYETFRKIVNQIIQSDLDAWILPME